MLTKREGNGLLRFLLTRVGGFRSALLGHTFGLMLITLQWQTVVVLPSIPKVPGFWGVPLIAVGIMLLALGSRLITLLVASPILLLAMWERVSRPSAFSQVADEYLIYAVQPALMLLAAAMAALDLARHDKETQRDEETRHDKAARLGQLLAHPRVDDAVVGIGRLFIVATMFFAGFHKLNTDFLDASTSCQQLTHRLVEWWAVPAELFESLRPLHVVIGELGAAVALLLAPRLGIVLVAVLVTGFAHIGPVAFGVSCLSLSLAFLHAADGPVLKQYFKRCWPWLLTVLAALLWVSHELHRSPRQWSWFVVYQSLLVGVGFGLAHLIWRDLRRGWITWREGLGIRSAGLEALGYPAAVLTSRAQGLRSLGRRTRVFLVSVTVFLGVMGMTPYTGLKLRLGFAMLSNLRADAARFNHLIVPRALLLVKQGPFIEVIRASIDKEQGQRERKRRIRLASNAHVAAWVLQKDLAAARKAKLRITLEVVEPDGSRRRIEDAANDPALRRRVDRLALWSRLFQKRVSRSGPQRCAH